MCIQHSFKETIKPFFHNISENCAPKKAGSGVMMIWLTCMKDCGPILRCYPKFNTYKKSMKENFLDGGSARTHVDAYSVFTVKKIMKIFFCIKNKPGHVNI